MNLEIKKIKRVITKSFDINYLFLISLWLFHLINNYIWLKIDTLPLVWDSARHYFVSLRYFDIVSHPSIDILHGIVSVDTSYPPLAKIVVIPFYAIFGRHPDTAVLVMNSIFLFIIIFSVYWLGKRLCNNNAGLLASFIVMMYPIIFGQSRWFMLDMSLVAMVSLGMYLLLLTDNFRNKKYSILFGIVSGLGMFAKVTYLVYAIGPIVYILFVRFKVIKKSQIINILYSLICCFLISSVWYVPNLNQFSDYLIYSAIVYGKLYNLPEVSTLESVLYYALNSIENLSFLFVLLFIATTLYLIKLRSRYVLFLMLWIFVPYLIFSLLINKNPRYIMPSLPAVALISAMGIEKIEAKKIKKSLIFLIAILALLQYFAISYGAKNIPENIPLIHLNPPIGTINLFSRNMWEVPRIRTDNWKTEEILHVITENTTQDRVTILIIPNNPAISCAIWYESYYHRLPIKIYFTVPEFCLGVSSLCHSPLVNSTSFYFDYVLTLKDEYGFVGWESEIGRVNSVQDTFEQHIDNFELIREIEMPKFIEHPDEKKPVLLMYKRKT